MMAGEDEEMHYSTGEDSYHSYDDLYIYSEDEESESDFSGLISNFWGEEGEEYDDTSSKRVKNTKTKPKAQRKAILCLVSSEAKKWQYCHVVGLIISFANPVGSSTSNLNRLLIPMQIHTVSC